MSIASEITRLQNAKAAIKASIEDKGVTVDPDDTLSDYNTYIAAIPSGGSVLTTKTITQNGTYDAEDDNADGYSSVTVSVSGGGGGVPDWSQIGYSSCPQSTLDGFNYAKDIATNWTNSADKHEYFLDNHQIMYFPKTASTSAMTNCSAMFRNSAVEDLEISIPAVTDMRYFLYDGRNVRSIKLNDIGNTITQMGWAFEWCYGLESFTTSKPLGEITSLQDLGHTFCGCHLLKSLDVSLPAGATASITNADNIVRECLGMETFTFIQPKCKDVSGWHLGRNTANGCLCNVQYGSDTTNNVWGEFRGSKIAAGSVFIIENIPSSSQTEMFRSDNGDTTIYENANSNITLIPKSGQQFNAVSLFGTCIFPNGCNHITITNIGNGFNMFGSTQFPGSNKTLDLSNLTWLNCTNFESMFNNCKASTIVGSVDITNATNIKFMFKDCTNLTAIPTFTGTTSAITDFNQLFYNCSSITSFPVIDTSNATNLPEMFSGCASMVTAPAINTEKGTNFSRMFQDCTALTTVPEYNLSKATNLFYMFGGSYALNDTSLDNILKMCIGATSYTGTKTLYELGFRSDRYAASRFTNLPNYQDFLNANWVVYP
jgi:hypothetical protein